MSHQKRTRTYQGLFYEEDRTLQELVRAIESRSLSALISPRHDKDVQEDGTPKKAHYHVLIKFDNPRTRNGASKIFTELGLHHQEKYTRDDTFAVRSVHACARYMCHLDQPNKYVYDIRDVIEIGSLDYQTLIKTKKATTKELREIEQIIINGKFDNIIELLMCLDEKKPHLVATMRKRYNYINALCKAVHYCENKYDE